jgi:hypothetical protein
MISAISNAAPAQPAAQPAATPTQKPTKSAPQSAPTDNVQLSTTAQASLAALQEIRETSAQTAQEAGKGDHQAQRLLAKEAAKSVTK